jgi:tRNA A-37 threonylcarbamoyl transferase component Bud32/tetratricopeptide (TPR) repeat protein
MSLTPGSSLGAYEIVAMIGAGGMGEVYRARDTKLGREVAIKVLPASLSQDPVARERLRREAVAAAGLDHPFICKVFEIGDTSGHLFIVMELVVGETLYARLSSGAVPLSEALAWALEIAEALETAHARQIVHRDLKPANVMVASQGHIKVMDFGLAKDVSFDDAGVTRTVAGGLAGPLTDRGARVGTPGYMAPEQIVGDAIDGRTDIFALGVLLCEAVAGAHPFRRATVAETASAILSEPPVITGRPSADVPSAVRQILQRMLAKSPAERYQLMADVRRDLMGVSSSTPSSWSHLGGGRWASSDRIGQARRWPMVGREAERADLMAKLDRAIAGHGSLVLLGGEPGIGKTRLTEAVQDEARARGCMSLVGHAYEMEGSPPYVPFVEMLEYSARVVPPAAMKHALGDAAPEVAKLMPELRQMFPDIPPALEVPPEQQRRMLFNGYRDFVERSCRMAPIVAVLEDLHWADDSTLQLLLHLAPAMASWPILVIGTYRDVELDVTRPFAKVLETLVRQRLATRMALRRLPAESVSELLSVMSGGLPVPSSLGRIVFNETEGNPFFVEEVFQHLKEEGRLFDAAGQWRTDMRVETLDVPEGVRLVIGRRLERLAEQSRRVLTTAAVIGRSFSLPLLESLEGADREDDVLVAIEEAEKAHLVAAQRAGRETRYLFAHELIRQTLAEALSMPRRQRLHGRIAEAIERVYASSLDKHASAMAHHLYQAGAAAEPEKTTKYLIAASDEARAASAPEDALRCLDQALSLWDDERGSRVADLHDRRGRVLRSLGRPVEAIKTLQRAVECWDPIRDVEPLVQTTVELALTHIWQADPASGAHMTTDVLGRLKHASPLQRFPLMQIGALNLAGAGRAAEALVALDAADAVRREACVPVLDLVALATEPHVRWMTMDLHRAVALSREAIAYFEAAGLLWQAADISYIETFSNYFLGRLPTETEFALVAARARRVGHTSAVGVNEALRSYVALQHGDLAAAERICREELEYNRAVQNRWGFFAISFAGVLSLLQGRVEQGLRELAEAERAEPPTYWLNQCPRMRFWALAHVAPAEAEAMVPSLQIGPVDPSVPNPFGAWMNVAALVPGLALIGRRDEAAVFARNAETLIEKGLVIATWTASSYSIAGIAAGCAREWDASEAHFRTALETAARLPLRLDEAYARVWYADMLSHRDRSGDRERARVLCGEAESLAAKVGAVLIEQRARDVRNSL